MISTFDAVGCLNEAHLGAMDPRWQPYLDHPPADDRIARYARELFASGWIALPERCTMARGERLMAVAPETWASVRELSSLQPVALREQPR